MPRSVFACALLAIGIGAAAFAEPSSDDWHTLVRRVKTLAGQKRYSEEIPELERVVKVQPTLPWAYYQLGLAYWHLGQNTKAIRAFDKDLSFAPPDPYALYYLGRIYLASGDLAGASKYLERAVKAGGVLDARQRLGATYLKLGMISRAVSVLSEAVRNDPENGSAHYILGRAYQRKGEMAKAEQEFALARKYKSVLQHSTAALLQLVSDLQTGKVAGAEKIAGTLESSDDFGAMLEAGKSLAQAGLPRDSIPLFAKASELRPRSAEPEYDLGRAYAALDEVDQSVAHLKKAVALNPEMYDSQLLLGTMLVDAGRSQQALTHLSKAAQLKPDNSHLLTMLGLEYLQVGYYDHARHALEQSLKLQPDSPKPYLLLVQAEYRSARYQAALNVAEKAVERFPDLAMSHYQYGFQLQNVNQLEHATAELKEAIAMNPSLTAAAVTLGQVLYKLGKPDKSLAEFQTVVSKDSSDMTAWSGIGKALIRLKRYKEAESQMDKAIAIKSDVPALHMYLAQALRARGCFAAAKREASVFHTLALQRAKKYDESAEQSYGK